MKERLCNTREKHYRCIVCFESVDGEVQRRSEGATFCVCVDLEKAYDKVPKEEVWYCMRKPGLAEKYVRIVQDMYDDSITAVRCAVGVTEGFEVKVGLHQGSV